MQKKYKKANNNLMERRPALKMNAVNNAVLSNELLGEIPQSTCASRIAIARRNPPLTRESQLLSIVTVIALGVGRKGN